MVSDDDFYYRAVSPSWVHDGIVSSQAFTATAKDAGLLSMYAGEKFTAKGVYEHFTRGSNQCAGTLGLTKSDVTEESLVATQDDNGFEGHVSLDLASCVGNAKKKMAKKLKRKALAHGWRYQPA